MFSVRIGAFLRVDLDQRERSTKLTISSAGRAVSPFSAIQGVIVGLIYLYNNFYGA